MLSDCLSKPGVQVAAAVILPNLGGWVNGIITKDNIKTWFEGLKHPSVRPPNYVFGPVWTALYSSMGYASYVAYKQGELPVDPSDLKTKIDSDSFRRRRFLRTRENPFDSVRKPACAQLGMEPDLLPLPWVEMGNYYDGIFLSIIVDDDHFLERRWNCGLDRNGSFDRCQLLQHRPHCRVDFHSLSRLAFVRFLSQLLLLQVEHPSHRGQEAGWKEELKCLIWACRHPICIFQGGGWVESQFVWRYLSDQINELCYQSIQKRLFTVFVTDFVRRIIESNWRLWESDFPANRLFSASTSNLQHFAGNKLVQLKLALKVFSEAYTTDWNIVLFVFYFLLRFKISLIS